MILIFLGLILIFVPVPILQNSEVGYLFMDYMPHFVGYALVLVGLTRQRGGENRSSALAVAASAILGSGAVWVYTLVTSNGVSFPVIEFLQAWMTYCLLRWCEGIEEMGQSYHIGRLRMSWYAVAGSHIAAFVLNLADPFMGGLWSVVALGAGVVYTYTFFRLQAMVER